jgi:hypothetical protein
MSGNFMPIPTITTFTTLSWAQVPAARLRRGCVLTGEPQRSCHDECRVRRRRAARRFPDQPGHSSRGVGFGRFGEGADGRAAYALPPGSSGSRVWLSVRGRSIVTCYVHPTFAASILRQEERDWGQGGHLSLPKGREGKMARGGIDGVVLARRWSWGAPVSGAAVGIPTTALAAPKPRQGRHRCRIQWKQLPSPSGAASSGAQPNRRDLQSSPQHERKGGAAPDGALNVRVAFPTKMPRRWRSRCPRRRSAPW